MTITINAGWWLLPSAVTMALFIWAAIAAREDGGTYGAGHVYNLLIYLVAAFGSVVAWLIWSLLR
ncbi:hypothetical protein Ga0061061_1106 [Chelatococcus sambhunathii]|uniref:Uncharacterized protein n=1 Tax=Chelatococcus sambhunathii TaxID=363953 RepID=A0ABP2AAA8_9HYPH|nr:hypothetical protein [Chelatococcus sambhunathii]CUA89810.1 hypothetical protein Ga0061061_1106 [Chelatococcus sambhunathii]